MSKKSKILEFGNTGKAFLSVFLGALAGGNRGRVNALKKKMKNLDDELADELDSIHKQYVKDRDRYNAAIKDLTPAQKKEFDKTFGR